MRVLLEAPHVVPFDADRLGDRHRAVTQCIERILGRNRVRSRRVLVEGGTFCGFPVLRSDRTVANRVARAEHDRETCTLNPPPLGSGRYQANA